jgi:hypothetical protein
VIVRLKSNLLFIVVFVFYAGVATAAEDFPVNARLFAGLTKVSPEDLNTEMTAQSLKKIDDITQFGVEATLTPFRYFNFGFRYTKRYVHNEENPASAATDYYGQIDQDSVLLIVRIPVIQSEFIRADVFGGAGGSNTTFTIKTATQSGELTRAKGNDWFATPCTAFGASVGVGYKKLYLVAEAGMESNKITKLDRTGNVNSNVSSIDLSGSYLSLGLMFTGIPPHKK